MGCHWNVKKFLFGMWKVEMFVWNSVREFDNMMEWIVSGYFQLFAQQLKLDDLHSFLPL